MKSNRKWIGLVVVVALVAVALGADKIKKPKNVFSPLRVGEFVSVKDVGSAFTITVFDPDLPQSHTVVEIGSDYIVLRDIANVTETVVPVYSVKAILKVRTNKA